MNASTTRTASLTVRPAGQPLVLAFFGGAYARELEMTGSLEAAARDVALTLSKAGRRAHAVLGPSFGCKVAIELAGQLACALPDASL